MARYTRRLRRTAHARSHRLGIPVDAGEPCARQASTCARGSDRKGTAMSTERIETVVIGGGQAGLASGYHLARTGRPFVILDASERIGDAWRNRWDSLRLFTPARYDALPGLPFPGRGWSFPSAAAFADYLREYAARWELPVRTGVTVRRL